VGCRLGQMWLTVVGLVVATAKPHLSGPLILTYSTGQVNDTAKLLRAISLFLHFGISLAAAQLLGILGLLLVLVLAGSLLRYSGGSLTRTPVALMLVMFSSGLARGIQGYDACCDPMGIALMATLDFRYRYNFLIPAALVWRSGLLDKVRQVVSGERVGSFAWLGLLIGTVILAGLQSRSYWTDRSSALVAEASSS
jgi:hypothetical protein